MTTAEQAAWARLARAAAEVGKLFAARCNRRDANRKLFEATVGAVLAGLPLPEAAEAMRAGWPELQVWEAIYNIEGYLERQALLDCDRLHRILADVAEGRRA